MISLCIAKWFRLPQHFIIAKLSFISSFFLVGQSQTLAQRNYTNLTCPNPISEIRDSSFSSWFNSTGTIPVQFNNQDDSWRISLSLTDMRAERLWFGPYSSMQQLSLWVSVPESLVGTEKGNRTNICAYTISGKNATATNSTKPKDSCKAIISNKCFKEYSHVNSPLQAGRYPRIKSSNNCDSFTAWLSKSPTSFAIHMIVTESRSTDKLI